jgi:microcompartment protein CcmK/EutM
MPPNDRPVDAAIVGIVDEIMVDSARSRTRRREE